MKTFLWKMLNLLDDNWGYSSPLQQRFRKGDKCKISTYKTDETPFVPGSVVTIIENCRHDYLVMNENGVKCVVYQHELYH